jgi:hypothetical protein
MLKLAFSVHTLAHTDLILSTQAETTHVAPGCQLNPHDFAITDDYYVFFENRGNSSSAILHN